MASFSKAEFDFRRLDLSAILSHSGLAVVSLSRRERCLAWLRGHGYMVTSLDCALGRAELVRTFGRLFHWEEQFGYSLESGSVNLDALRDGFEFNVPEQGGSVLELVRPDVVWQEDTRWLMGLLSIAQEHCRFHHAFGRRFLTLLVLPEGSPLVGQVVEQSVVPAPYRYGNVE